MAVKVEYLNKLANTLVSEGWQEILKPAVIKLRDNSRKILLKPGAQKELRDNTGKVTMTFTDDFLKGQIDTLEWLLSWDQRVDDLARELTAETEAPDNPEENGVGTPYAPAGQPVGGER